MEAQGLAVPLCEFGSLFRSAQKDVEARAAALSAAARPEPDSLTLAAALELRDTLRKFKADGVDALATLQVRWASVESRAQGSADEMIADYLLR